LTTTIVDGEVLARGSPTTDHLFLEEIDKVSSIGDSGIMNCIQCGSCGGSCPSSQDMEHTPRKIFALIAAGKREQVLKSNTFWYCVSCYQCVVRCPREVKITDIMYSLKRMAIQEGFYRESEGYEATGLANYFMDYVENYGRSFELGLASRFTIRYRPLQAMKMAPMGLGMWRKGRMDLTPNRIKNLKQFKAILKKAREIEGES
jgi:heterodisulfide reductase subunit C